MADINNVTITNNKINASFFYNDTEVFTYTVEYPSFEPENPDTASVILQRVLLRMNLYYEQQADLARQYFSKNLRFDAIEQFKSSNEEAPFNTYEAIIKYTVTYNENCAVSLYTDTYEYTGGAHGLTLRTSDTWNLNTGQKYNLRAFFPNMSNYRTFIIQSIYRQIGEKVQDNTEDFFDDYKDLVVKTFNENNFYLVPEGVVIYFQQYDIAPYVSGINEFVIPFEAGAAVKPKCVRMGDSFFFR